MAKATDKARARAAGIATLMLIFSILSIISLSLMFMMTTWITIVYGCGSRSELDLTSPLQNFSRKIFPSYYDLGSATPFRLNSHGGIDLDYAWKFLVASYIVSTISMLFIIPQFFGAVHLLKATEADTPFELANWHANRYLFTQRVVMAVEFVGMMMIGATCLIWPILLQFNVTFMAYISLLFIVCCRYKANGFVEKFIRALAREAVQPQMNGRWMQLLKTNNLNLTESKTVKLGDKVKITVRPQRNPA